MMFAALYASISYQLEASDMARDIADVADLFEDEDIDEKALYVARLWQQTRWFEAEKLNNLRCAT